MTKNSSAFTLIELLIVIAIIGLLASIVMVATQSARAKARDAKRVDELNQIRVALELYYAQYGKYPDGTDSDDAWGACGGWDGGSVLGGEEDTFIQPLVSSGIMPKVPIEKHPVNNDQYHPLCGYRYIKQSSAVCQCTQPFAVLNVVLETSSNPAAKIDNRPECIKYTPAGSGCWGEGAGGKSYAIYLPY